MFDYVRNNKKFIQIILALIVLPFALWGVESYVKSSGSGDGAAKVGGTTISLPEFQQALREQQDRLRPQLGGNVSPDVLESPELRRAVVQELINQRLLLLYASQSNMRVGDDMLASFITNVPSLQENGKFSRERYEALVASQGMSVEMFEARVRQDLLTQQAMAPIGNAVFSGHIPADRFLAAQLEEREVRTHMLRAEQFTAGSKPEAAEIKRYYEENLTRFEKPEQVRVEYLELKQDALIANAKVTEEEIKAWYQANQARYKRPEERQASHILIRADKKAPEAEVKAAEEKANMLLAQLKVKPADFASFAKANSQDPGSAEKGGDLGYFGHGMMVKPFEDAIFALKEGEMSGVVRTDFGFHIIKLTGIHPEQIRPLEEVRGEIATELKRQTGARQFAEMAEGFANTVYEQPDSLKPAAEKYGLKIQTSDWIAKGGQAVAPFANPKLLQAIFSEDAVKHQRNTESVDVGANTLLSARVIEHHPASVEPLESVSATIEKVLVLKAAAAKAEAAGKSQLEMLTKGEKVDVVWDAPQKISRLQASGLPPGASAAIFAASPQKLPAFAGAKVPGGFALYRIEKVSPYDEKTNKEAAAIGQALHQRYAQAVAQEELLGWLSALRQRYPVTINSAALERK